ncbi:hypothetical protein ALNOE001_14600 [Candidatus Methanobinarius endosymbioticus]|uniref:Uncharacterized protein n=1 Tax=Candidatus Methanobinarius endosymbioticus TaxID=2006182 RepID=A0A366MA11_9EURY|nr:hypothetical protein ALNOE001_14600 [Candidatus Methanobinarius endosymbioticus]
MDALEALTILILAGAIIVLLYYYLQNNTQAMSKFKAYMPATVQNNREEKQITRRGLNMSQNSDADSSSMGEKLKVKFKDIDMPNFGTDSFSKKIDSFLDEKSDELIRDWSLATKDDLNILEKSCETAYKNADEITKRFKEYREYTNEKLASIDKRLKKLEEE